MHHDASDPQRFGCVHDAEGGVAEEGAAEALSLGAGGDREAAEDGDGDRVGHVAAEAPGGAVRADGAGGDGVIGDDAAAFGHDEGAGRAAGPVGAGAAPQPVIQ